MTLRQFWYWLLDWQFGTRKEPKSHTQLHPFHLSHSLIDALQTKAGRLDWHHESLFADWPKSQQCRLIVLFGLPIKATLCPPPPLSPAQRKPPFPPRHAQAKRDAVPKPKYLFSFSFLSGTDDPFQRGGERGTRREETGKTAREGEVPRKQQEGGQRSSIWHM